MLRNPVIAAWVAGGLIWGAALLGLGTMGGPVSLGVLPEMTHQMAWPKVDDVADAYERALDGDPWGDADRPHGGLYRPAGAPDS